MKRSTLETEIQRQIEADIGAESDLLLLRNSVGVAKHTDEHTGKTWHVPYGLGVGSPDLVGILKLPCHLAAWIVFEVKAPEGVVEPEQETCHRTWRSFGVLVYVVRSVADARRALEDARKFAREMLRVLDAAQFERSLADLVVEAQNRALRRARFRAALAFLPRAT